jgi:hypothetical protein
METLSSQNRHKNDIEKFVGSKSQKFLFQRAIEKLTIAGKIRENIQLIKNDVCISYTCFKTARKKRKGLLCDNLIKPESQKEKQRLT